MAGVCSFQYILAVFHRAGFSHFHCNTMRKAIKGHKNLHTNQQNEHTKEAHV